jgi:hypothetical protein
MKATKEVILKLEFTGDEVKSFLEIIEKVILGESASNLGIGILDDNQTKLLKEILKTSKQE